MESLKKRNDESEDLIGKLKKSVDETDVIIRHLSGDKFKVKEEEKKKKVGTVKRAGGVQQPKPKIVKKDTTKISAIGSNDLNSYQGYSKFRRDSRRSILSKESNISGLTNERLQTSMNE